MWRFAVIILLLLSVMLATGGCGRDADLASTLDRADAMLEEHPDSALQLLAPYEGLEIRNKGQRARFAVLYSMALDKNYIDTTDFRVLQPALDYYPSHGTVADKLRTLYYQGIIYKNAGHTSDAMQAWAQGMLYDGEATDSLTLARLLVALGNEYYYLYRFDDFIDNNRRAEDIFRRKGKTEQADKALLYQFEAFLSTDSVAAVKRYPEVVRIAQDTVSSNGRLARSLLLIYEGRMGTKESLAATLESFEGLAVDYLDLTQANLNLGRTEAAQMAFDSVKSYGEGFSSVKYLYVKARLEEAQRDFEASTATYKELLTVFDSVQHPVISGDLQFIEERTGWQKSVRIGQEAEERVFWIGMTVAIFLTGLIAVVILRNHASRLRLERDMVRLEREKAGLESMVRNVRNPEIRKVISDRLSLLNRLAMDKQDSGKSMAAPEIRKMMSDRKKFMRDSRMAMTATHPKFMARLRDFGLSDEELDYVCLYAIGMNGKEVGAFMERSSHYNMSSTIRAKLGLEKSGPRLRGVILDLLKNSGDF